MSIKRGLIAFWIALALGASGANAQVDNAREAQRAYEASTQEYNEVAEAARHYRDVAIGILQGAIEVERDLSEDE